MPVPRTLQEDQAEFQRLRTGSIAAGAGKPTAAFPAVVELLWNSARQQDTSALLSDSLPAILSAFGADFIALVRSRDARTGERRPLPQDLLAEVLDREAAAGDGQWMAAPLTPRDAASGVLVAHVAKPAGDALANLDALAAALAAGLSNVKKREQQYRRTEQLETILGLAAQWNQTHEMAPLLEQMAEAATRLLKADRASIFLWDKPNRTLVGRPAMGVAGGELRIPDDAGIVGQVVQRGTPRRIATADLAQQQEIDRQVDSKLGYQTRSLVCAPLRTPEGEMLGAFEVINKLGEVPQKRADKPTFADFSADDEAVLVELACHAATALANTQALEDLVATHRQIVDQAAGDVRLIGKSPPIETLRSTIGRVAKTDLAVLLLGENGTGKEVVSQAIHYLSARRSRPFIAVNCAAITETLLESELFGHEKGAFTDAHEARAGKFELAGGGTLFLDEIGDLSRGGQAKLLRVLEEKIVVRVGGSKPIHTDARVIAATNQDLAVMVREKRFREDLYFRLNVVTLDLPPLRKRGDDVLLLAEHFLAEFSRKARRRPPKLSAQARKRLEQHTWPGNVRELRNLMERLAYLSAGERIEAEELAFILSPRAESASVLDFDGPLTEATHQFQIEYIKRAIDRTRGNMTDAAALLGLHRSNLYRKMRQLGMSVEEESDE
jgi:transcriptional regulator with GAF, ATPase, and Fis domain